MLCLRGVDGVTRGASDAICQMRRSHEILVTFARLMTRQTPFASLFRAQSCEADNLGGIASGVDVGFARAVAALTALPLRASVFVRLRSPMRAVFVAGGLRFMARLACIRANV
jgi:hypothetical protein